LRGPKAIAAVVRPFGRLIKLDSPSLARSDLRWARGVVEVASRELIPPFLWFELLKSSGLVRHIQLRFKVEGSVLPPGVGTDSSGTDTIQPVSAQPMPSILGPPAPTQRTLPPNPTTRMFSLPFQFPPPGFPSPHLASPYPLPLSAPRPPTFPVPQPLQPPPLSRPPQLAKRHNKWIKPKYKAKPSSSDSNAKVVVLSVENAALKAQLNIMKGSLAQPTFSHMLTSSPMNVSVPSLAVHILSDGLCPSTTPSVVASASDGPSSPIIVASTSDAPVVACPKAHPSTILGVPPRSSTQPSDELKSGLEDKQLLVAVPATSGIQLLD
jgi:hypothetical protein